jgi:hypothetical protein
MFAGHVGVGLALASAQRRVNLGVFVTGALLLDFLLWLFVLLGWESLTIPPDFAATHQVSFDFPWSHGLLTSLGWSAAAGVLTMFVLGPQRPGAARAGWLMAAAVFSHWLLDALVHRPEMPLGGASTYRVGLGLWGNMPVALAIEALLIAFGLAFFLRRSPLTPARRAALAVFTMIILLLTVAGMTVAPAPPSAVAMAGSSLVSLAAVCGLSFWLGRSRPPAA